VAVKVDEPEAEWQEMKAHVAAGTLMASSEVTPVDSKVREESLESGRVRKLTTELDQGQKPMKVEQKAGFSDAVEHHASFKRPDRTTSTPAFVLSPVQSSSSTCARLAPPSMLPSSIRSVHQKPIDSCGGSKPAVATTRQQEGLSRASDHRNVLQRIQDLRRKRTRRAASDGPDRAFRCHIENAVAAPSGESSQESKR
jgi:hypothetical protein